MLTNKTAQYCLLLVLSALCFTPFVSTPLALIIGLTFGYLFTSEFKKLTSKYSKYILQASIVGLGFGLNINEALVTTKDNFLLSASFILGTLIFGYFIAKYLKLNDKIGVLISAGTAICGGSAIAAVSQVIDADSEDISLSLALVFLLNGLGLLIFPELGRMIGLSEYTFGVWSAISIHDTSSVVGAAQAFGQESVKIATTLKLARALWIVPVSFIVALYFKTGKGKLSIPNFILLYLAAIVVNSFLQDYSLITSNIVFISKKLLSIAILLIGFGLNWNLIKKLGLKVIAYGVLLWVVISLLSLYILTNFH